MKRVEEPKMVEITCSIREDRFDALKRRMADAMVYVDTTLKWDEIQIQALKSGNSPSFEFEVNLPVTILNCTKNFFASTFSADVGKWVLSTSGANTLFMPIDGEYLIQQLIATILNNSALKEIQWNWYSTSLNIAFDDIKHHDQAIQAAIRLRVCMDVICRHYRLFPYYNEPEVVELTDRQMIERLLKSGCIKQSGADSFTLTEKFFEELAGSYCGSKSRVKRRNEPKTEG